MATLVLQIPDECFVSKVKKACIKDFIRKFVYRIAFLMRKWLVIPKLFVL